MLNKKLIRMISFLLLFSFATPVFAQPVTDYNPSMVRDVSESDDLETQAIKEKDAERAAAESKAQGDELVFPDAEDPGVGATRVIIDGWSSGYTYQDDEAKGTANLIWNIALTIASYFTRTAGNIILDVAQLYLDNVDKNKGSTSRLLHSYYYPDKLGQVWTSNRVWKTYYTSRNREWYRHHHASYVNTAGVTRTYTRDYTRDLGYSPIHVDRAPHYNDNSYIANAAWERWYLGKTAGGEDWNGVWVP